MARSTMTAPFVARTEQVAALTQALDRAADGSPSAVLLGADAGVGKTRLLAEVAERAAAAGATTITTHCIDLGEVGLPYLPFAEALTQLQALPAFAETVERVAEERPAVARLLPGRSSAAPVSTDDQSGRLPLFDGIAAVLAEVGRPGAPLLLVVEDLHWADPSSRDVLRFLISRLRHEHLLLVGSYRADDLHRTHPLRPVLAELARHPRVERLDLPPFTDAELREFTAAVHGSALSESAQRRIAQRSEGNAYFAEELVEAGPEAVRLPGSLGDVLRSRLEQAQPHVNTLARIASVAGRRVSEPLLRAVARDRLGGQQAFDAALADAVALNLLRGEDGRIAFRHALLAEAVYADLLPGEQIGLHRAYLEAILADRDLGSHAELAHHARNAHDWQTTVRASLDAAQDAADVLAPVEEMRHLKTALRYWDSVPDPAAVPEDRAGVLHRAARAASRGGRLEYAVGLARDAVAAAEEGSEQQAALRTTLARTLLGIDRQDEAVVEAARALADLGPDGPAGPRAWALATHARASLVADRDDEAQASATEAVTIAREGGEPAAEADALATLAVLLVDDETQAAELLATARRRAQEAGDLLTEQRCAYNLVTTYYYAGRLDDADAALSALLERSRETGLSGSEFGLSALFFRELIRFVRGDLTPPDFPLTDLPTTMAQLLEAVGLYAAVARGEPGALDRGRALKGMWDDDAQVALLSGGCTIDALIWTGAHDEAVELGTSLIEHLVKQWTDYFLGGIWLAALVLAALADAAAADRLAGADPALRVARGHQLLELAVTTAERGRPRGGRLGPEGRAWLARAHAEHSRLVGTDDLDLWRRATEAFGYGYRYETARSRLRWAEAALTHGDRSTAQEQCALARAEATAIGATPLVEAVAALSRRGRLELPGTRTPAVLLTDRESEVLELVAQGLTNRQIGERLFISGKTVSVHVSNLLAKLQASGRAEAVALAHRRGLLGGAPQEATGR